MLHRLFFQLWAARVTAGCEEHGIGYPVFKECLARNNILLNKKTLADLACWEPYSFKSLTDIAKQTASDNGIGLKEPLKPPHLTMEDIRNQK